MTPSLCISQKRYKINGDTVIVFTPSETRKLAIKLLEGEKYEKLYLNEVEINNLKDSIITFQSYNISIRDSLLIVSTDIVDSLNNKVIDYQTEILQERRAKKRNGYIAGGSVFINILLIILMI